MAGSAKQGVIVRYVLLLFLVSCASYREVSDTEVGQRSFYFAYHTNTLIATYFPPSHTSSYDQSTVLLFDPLFIKKDYLHRGKGGGIIAHLNRRGHPVWLIHLLEYRDINSEEIGSVYMYPVLQRIADFSGTRKFDLGGLSLGGRTWLPFMQKLAAMKQSASKAIFLRKIFFLGTGFDYNYPGSFAEAARKAGWNGIVRAECGFEPPCTYFTSETNKVKPADMIQFLPELSFSREQIVRVSRYRLPLMVITGKIDSIAPIESAFPVYKMYGTHYDDRLVAGRIPKVIVDAGRNNSFSRDYDHYMLFGYEKAYEIYDHIADFLAE